MGNNTKELIKIDKLNEVEQLNKYRVPLMGFAALWILIFHAWLPVFDGYVLLFKIEKYVKIIGYYGVDIFFLLSGIGLTYSIKKGNTWKFYYKRIKRILVPFLITAIALKIYNNWSSIEFIKRVTFYSFYTESIYRLLWFVPAIATLYIVFPIYYKLFKKISRKTLFTVTIVAIISIILILFRNLIRSDLYGFINRIPIFLIGILLGWKEQNKEITYNKNRYKIYIFMLFVGLVLSYYIKIDYWYFLDYRFDLFLPNMLVAISLSFLLPQLFEIAINSKKKFINKTNKMIIFVLSFIGTMSLEIYCVQELIVGFLNKIPKSIITNFIIIVVTLIIGSSLYIINKYFWILIEKVSSKIINNKKKERNKNDKI